MKRIIFWLLLLTLPAMAFADGRVIPPVAFPARVTMPDQRALIHFTNGVERLVIETRFTGEGTNFAWVVPLPSQPVIEQASTGLFPTLQYLFQPRITHNFPRYYPGILFLVLLFCFVRLKSESTVTALQSLLIVFVFAVLVTFFLPALSATKGSMAADSAVGDGVSVLDRKLVGIFETTTIASRDAGALRTWLTENGFVVPADSQSVIADYVKEEWVFVAAKVTRASAARETSTPHPLSFTFKTDKPVYPMRLTGTGNDQLGVELYVFGPSRAEAEHFKVERCTQPAYPEPQPRELPFIGRRGPPPESPEILHPLLRQWVVGSPVATKLTANLSAADMRQDVWLNWTSFEEKKNRLFSRAGASTIALNWASGLLAALIVAGILKTASESGLRRWMTRAFLVSAAVAGIIYLSLPKMAARVVRAPRDSEYKKLSYLYDSLMDTNPVTRAEISVEARKLLTTSINNPEWIEWARDRGLENWNNDLLGGSIHEEDSPGNFTLHENGDELEFVFYDSSGGEHVMLDSWRLRH